MTAHKYIVRDGAVLDGDLVLEWYGDETVPVGQALTVLEGASV